MSVMNIGYRIKQKREELRISVSNMAKLLGMTRQNVYNLENQEHINTRTLVKIAEVLKTDFFWFLESDTNMLKEQAVSYSKKESLVEAKLDKILKVVNDVKKKIKA
jgi:transcriptional regulator with XRE-family HTH domain